MRCLGAALALVLSLGCDHLSGLGNASFSGGGPPRAAAGSAPSGGMDPDAQIPFACETTCGKQKECGEPAAVSCADACKKKARATRECRNELEVWAHVRDACAGLQCVAGQRAVTVCVQDNLRAWCQPG